MCLPVCVCEHFFIGGGTQIWPLLLTSFATTKLVIALVSVAKSDKRLLNGEPPFEVGCSFAQSAVWLIVL